MLSFYGGPNGRSFYLKAIFTSKNGSSDSLKHDLSLGWTSPIGESEFVVVSYGMPGDDSYEIYKDRDLNSVDARSFNSTLWEKCYDESKNVLNTQLTIGNPNGWYYRLVASMTGNTPRISIDKPIEIVGPAVEPDIWIENPRDIDFPVFHIRMPRAVRFQYGSLLGQKRDYASVTDSSLASYDIGDYYIDTKNAYIYTITNKSGITADFKYVTQFEIPELDLSTFYTKTEIDNIINNIQGQIGDNLLVNISKKADKVVGATAGHIAILDATGNLVDSGKTVNEIGKPLVLRQIKLPATGWSAGSGTNIYICSVAVPEIVADSTKQKIDISPYPNSANISNIANYSIYCSDQGNKTLTFTAENGIPAAETIFNISIQDI